MLGWSLSRILVGCENDTEHQLCRIRVYHLLQTSRFLTWRHSKATSCIHSAVISLFILYFILVFDKIVVRPCAVEVFLSWNLLPVNPRMSWHSVGVKGSSCGTEEAYQSLCSCWNLDFFLIRFIVHTRLLAAWKGVLIALYPCWNCTGTYANHVMLAALLGPTTVSKALADVEPHCCHYRACSYTH